MEWRKSVRAVEKLEEEVKDVAETPSSPRVHSEKTVHQEFSSSRSPPSWPFSLFTTVSRAGRSLATRGPVYTSASQPSVSYTHLTLPTKRIV